MRVHDAKNGQENPEFQAPEYPTRAGWSRPKRRDSEMAAIAEHRYLQRYSTLFNAIQRYSTLFNAIQRYSTLFNAKFRKIFRGDRRWADLASERERKEDETSEHKRTPNARTSGTVKESVHAISAYFMLLYAIAADFNFFRAAGTNASIRCTGHQVQYRDTPAVQGHKFPLKRSPVLANMRVRFGGDGAAKRAATINS